MSKETRLGTAFEAIVISFDQQLHCEMDTRLARCRRTAHWRLDLHGCEQVLICGQHLSAWKHRGQAAGRGGLISPKCVHCGRTFISVDDAYTVLPL